MTGRESHTQFLAGLPAAQRDAQLRQELTDSLQELVACIERSLPLGGNTLHSCMIDEFEMQKSELRGDDCRVLVRFKASARQGVGGAAALERITGCAEAVISDRGSVSYRDVRFAEDPAVVAPDIGGGD